MARFLAIVMVLTCVPIHNYQVARAAEDVIPNEENEVLPFSLEVTDEGVEDAGIIAKKLVLKNDNASIIDTGLTDLVVVKEIVHNVQAKVYLVSSQGVLHTFLVDADDPWLDKLEARKIEGWSHTTNDVFNRIRPGKRMTNDAFDDYGGWA